MIQSTGTGAVSLNGTGDNGTGDSNDGVFITNGASANTVGGSAAAANLILAQNHPDLTVMTVLSYYRDTLTARNRYLPTGLPAVWGHTPDGRYVIAVYEEFDDLTILPVTAYEVPEPG